jgi:hypothetical protein
MNVDNQMNYESPIIEVVSINVEGTVLTQSDGYNFGIGDWENGEDDGGVAGFLRNKHITQ